MLPTYASLCWAVSTPLELALVWWWHFAWTGGWLHRLVGSTSWDDKRGIWTHRSIGNTKRFATFIFQTMPSCGRVASPTASCNLTANNVSTVSLGPHFVWAVFTIQLSPAEENSLIKMYNAIPSHVPNARTRGFYGRFPSLGISTTHPILLSVGPPCLFLLCPPIIRVHVTVQPAQPSSTVPSPSPSNPNPGGPLVVVLVVRHEKVLVQAVARKGDRRDAQAGEGALEPVEAAEAARVAPRLAVERG